MAKFLSVDPLTGAYPWYSPYQYAGNKPIRFIDLDGLEEADPLGSEFAAARKIVTEFETNQVGNKFRGTDKQLIVNQLRARLDNTQALYQGSGSWLCGVAAVTYTLLTHSPVDYTKTIIDLFQKGKAVLNGVEIEASSTMFNESFPDEYGRGSKNMPMIDYILLGALRNSENFWVDYDPAHKTNILVAGTLPTEISDFIEGYFALNVDASELYPFYVKEELVQKTIEDNKFVILLIDGGGFSNVGDKKKGKKSSDGWYGKHYIVVRDKFEIDNDKKIITLNYWDYGQIKENVEISIKNFNESVKGIWHISNKKEK